MSQRRKDIVKRLRETHQERLDLEALHGNFASDYALVHAEIDARLKALEGDRHDATVEMNRLLTEVGR